MDDVVDGIDRCIVCRRLDGFSTAALIDGDINDDSTGFHQSQVFTSDQFRRLTAVDQDCTDDDVRFLKSRLDISIITVECIDTAAEDVIQIGEPSGINIKDADIGTDAHSDLAGVRSDHAPAEDRDFPAAHTRYAAQ